MGLPYSAILTGFALFAFAPVFVRPNPMVDGYNAADERADYTGYKVVRIDVRSNDDSEALLRLEGEEGIELWTSPKFLGLNDGEEESNSQAVDVMVAPEAEKTIRKFLENRGASEPRVLIPDVQAEIEKQREDERLSGYKFDSPEEMDWKSYHGIDTIYAFLDDVVKGREDIATVDIYGTSSEGRPLKAVKIKSGKAKKGIFIEAGSHAREWITPATATYIINELLTNSSNAKLLEDFDWFIVPSANPDGYEFSRQSNRLWRKTRSKYNAAENGGKQTKRFCTGVDPNRNWDFHWFEGGSSNIPCSEVYAGPSAFSEPETKDLSEYILRHTKGSNIVAYFAIHSYSELWLLPWGYTNDTPDDLDELKRLAKVGVDALRSVHGTNYKLGTVPGLLYISSGSSIDWAKGVAGIKYSYTLELRDKGAFGFLLPPRYILPSAEETWEGLRASAFDLSNL